VSVTLREQQAEPDLREQMDPAAKSLADALRITYRLVQVAAVGIAGLFLLSGFQAVQEGQRGIRLLLGRVQDDGLAPGFQFTLPEPFGEIVKVRTGAETLRLDREFFPNLPEQDRGRALSELRFFETKLDPGSDGQLITGDFNLAHTRVGVTYRRDNIRQNAGGIHPDAEERMIRAAVQRGVLQAAAVTGIDDFVKQSGSNATAGSSTNAAAAATAGPLAQRAREAAQQTLDAMGTGIRIDDLTLVDRAPMLALMADFQKVQSNQSEAKKEIETATQERVRRLTDTAGEVHTTVLRLIDRYDQQLRGTDKAAAEATLAQIDEILDGREVTVDGQVIPALAISGDVARKLSNAREYRSSVVSRAQADAALFLVKLDAYRKNPSVLLTGEWVDAFTAFMSRENIEAFILPPGARIQELTLNRDPDRTRELEVLAQRRAAEDRMRRVMDESERNKFSTGAPSRTVRE
jgi:regulator of protease activity HflC (stomatin/prohibitin superfamily)